MAPVTLNHDSPQSLLADFKAQAGIALEAAYTRFRQNTDETETLILERSGLLDELLQSAFAFFFGKLPDGIALIAVGGYGREELLPFSDIDLLILVDNKALTAEKDNLEAFVTFLWDTNLEIGHSVRTIEDCIEQAIDDLSTATNLLESRFVTGDERLYDGLFVAITSDKVLTSEEFFRAKLHEQDKRHRKLKETEYNLEPNVKNSPGGLRDIQMIGWVTKKHFDHEQFDDFGIEQFLSMEDIDILGNGQNFLLKIRFALHMIAGRKQDRLLFEYQRSIAECLGYQDSDESLAVEQMMKQYYRWVLALSELNEMLLHLFNETFITHAPDQVKPVNERFLMRNDRLEVVDDKVFERYPSALLEVFLLFCKNSGIRGVRASTIRLIRDHRHVIDNSFRKNPQNRALFVDILQSKERVASSIELMLRYGILGKFIPEFGKIVGQTQLDLFHIYTVDAHTIMVLKNMRRFTYDTSGKFPLATRIMAQIKDRELLYLACLFHDIAKGRGGDHSVLGAADAFSFCRDLGFKNRDARLVSWLVKHHLYMSRTAQKRDLSDPEVIRRFALRIGDKRHLDSLFLLTVADINGTNPELWNSWRAALLYQLYQGTLALFKQGLETITDKQELVQEQQQKALAELVATGLDTRTVEAFWAQTGDDYFLRESTEDIIWHTRTILAHKTVDKTLVFASPSRNEEHQGISQIFVYTKDKRHTFAKVTAFLEQAHLSIVSARVYSSLRGFTLDTFLVIAEDGKAIEDHRLDRETMSKLAALLEDDAPYESQVQRRTPRQLKFFPVETRTAFYTNQEKGFNILEVTTADRPGLLALIGELFIEFSIELIDAKITTLGERVEDIFYIRGSDGPITDPATMTAIESSIRTRLDRQVAKTSQ